MVIIFKDSSDFFNQSFLPDLPSLNIRFECPVVGRPRTERRTMKHSVLYQYGSSTGWQLFNIGMFVLSVSHHNSVMLYERVSFPSPRASHFWKNIQCISGIKYIQNSKFSVNSLTLCRKICSAECFF